MNMIHIRKFLSFLKREPGNALIEFAFCLPIFLILLLSVFELNSYILANNRLSRTASEISDLLSRQQNTGTAVVAILQTPNITLSSYGFSQTGGIVASNVYNNGNTTQASKMLIGWQKSVGTTATKIGSVGGVPSNIPNGFVVTNDREIVIVEIFLSYTPTFLVPFLNLKKQLYQTAVFPSRVPTLRPLLAE
jgi:Flp pilus assembly protein TadG